MNLSTEAGSRLSAILSKKRLLIIAVVLLIIAAAAVLTTNHFKSKNTRGVAFQQATASVVKGDLNVTVSGSGPIRSSSKYTLTSNVNGTLTKLYIKDGDKVKAGDLIFEIDDKDAQLQIKQLKNSIAQAQLSLDSNIKDLRSGTVAAPFDGEIADIQVREGDSLSNNGTLLTITDKSKLKLLVPFKNTYRNELSIGQKVMVNVYDTEKDELHKTEGSISTVSMPSYTTNDGAEVYNVGIILDNNSLLNEGMVANAQIAVDGSALTSMGSNTLGYVRSMTVKASSGGIISKLSAENGQTVRKGDVLAELENDELEMTIQTNELKLEDLNSELQTAEEKLLDYKIYAPFDGTLTLNDIEQGNSIKQGDILGNVANYDTMEFDINVDELDISKIKEGQQARITIDALPETAGKPLSGEVTKIAVEGTSSNGVSTYPVTVQIENNSSLKGSMSANAEIVVHQKTGVLYVPVDAIQKRNGKSFVRVVGGSEGGTERRRNTQADTSTSEMKKTDSEQQFEMREVKTGISTEEYIEILEGLKEGEKVAVTASSNNTNTRGPQGGMMIMGSPAPGGGGSFRRVN